MCVFLNSFTQESSPDREAWLSPAHPELDTVRILGYVYIGSPILIFFSTNWSFDQSHQIFSHQNFFRADLIGQNTKW